MDSLLRDLRFTLRTWRSRPTLTAAAIVCLALGIGATTIVFSLVNAVLLEPLPFEDPDELVTIWTRFARQGIEQGRNSGNELADYRDQNQVFDGVEALIPWYFNLVADGNPERLVGGMVSSGLFPLLGVDPQIGRHFTVEEGQNRDPVVILSHRLWQRRFGGDENLMGQPVSLGGNPYTVVGVMPSEFSFLLDAADMWVPWSPNLRFPRHVRTAMVVARLKDGISIDRAQSDLDTITSRFHQDHAQAYPEDSGFGLQAISLFEVVIGDVRPQILTLLAAVVLVLLIACGNVANLLLVQATGREREMALRATLGAGRGRILRQLLAESSLLGIVGGLFGLLLAFWGVRGIRSMEQLQIPRAGTIELDTRVLLFAFLISLFTGILFGLAPALKASKRQLFDALREGGRVTGGGQWLRRGLVVAETALALVVLMAAGLMWRTFQQLERIDPGFRTDDVVTMQVYLSGPRYRTPESRLDFYHRLMAGLQERPELGEASLISHLPLSPVDEGGEITVEGREVVEGQPNPSVSWRFISPNYFQVMGLPLLRGRYFDERDHETAPPTVIVDANLAERLWPNEDPVGQRIRLTRDPVQDHRTVVGVVGAIRNRTLTNEGDELLYVPYPQYTYRVVALALDTPLEASAAGKTVREVLDRVDSEMPLARILDTGQMIEESRANQRLNRLLFGLFGLAALILVAAGIYGVMAHSVSQRTHEIGLRQALGAEPETVRNMVVGQGLRLVLWGVVLGLGLVLWLSFPLGDYLSDLLFEVDLLDPLTLVVVAVLVAGLAFLASFVPALRAARVNPIDALRQEA